MDYTPITLRRVLLGFTLTGIVAIVPEAIILMQGNSAMSFLSRAWNDYGGIVLAAGIALGVSIIGFTILTGVFSGRDRRLFRA